jgi:hypothetical protein
MPIGAFEHITDYFPGVSASVDLSAKQYFAVYLSSATTVSLSKGSASEVPIGILQNEPGSGMSAQVAYRPGDICKAFAGGLSTCDIGYGNAMYTDANGYIVKQATSNCPAFCRALVSTTASGVIPVLLTGPFRVTTPSLNS